MRKFLVVMLVLAIAGMAFAEEGKGTWSAFTAEGSLSTTMDFFNQEADTEIHGPGISGGKDAWLKLRWDYVNENWAIELPFQFKGGYAGIEKNDDGDHLGKIIYNPSDSGIKVEIPFGFDFSQVDGLAPITWGDASVNATYTGENYEFKLGVKNVLTAPAVGNVGGKFSLMGGNLELVASSGAYGTEWWRASDISIGGIRHPNNVRLDADATPAEIAAARRGNVSGWWENVEPNGIAARYWILPGMLNAGVAFAGEAGKALFTGYTGVDTGKGELLDRSKHRLLDDFLQPTFGVGFTSDFGLDATAMLGLRSAYISDPAYATVWDEEVPGKVVGAEDNKMGVVTTFGAKFTVPLDFDLSVRGDFTLGTRGAEDAQVYFGAQVDFGMDVGSSPLQARLLFRSVGKESDLFWVNDGGDLVPQTSAGAAAKLNPYYSAVNQLGLWVGFNRTLKGDRDGGFGDFNDPNAGLWAAAFLHIDDLTPVWGEDLDKDAETMADRMRFGLAVGYNGLELLDGLKLSASANLEMYQSVYDVYTGDFAGYDQYQLGVLAGATATTEKNRVTMMKFSVKPELVWTVAAGASITLGYELGSSNILELAGTNYAGFDIDYSPYTGRAANGIDINNLSLKFKWSF